MATQAFVDSVIKEIIQPGVDRLMESRYFSELRQETIQAPVAGLGDSALHHNHSAPQGFRSLHGQERPRARPLQLFSLSVE